MTWVFAALAGGAGALARFELSALVQRRQTADRPWGTAVVNLLGAFALGLIVGAAAADGLDSAWIRVAGGGFLGGFTTFSTWMVESVNLRRDTSMAAAAVNVVGMLVVGVLAARLGWILA